ncbi:hypothetical protein NDU88_001681 [Pleurodeles waltl]|uniref:Uncharacterized protein n=1 Tax=Pleurodeles waltl TaxID=8319 RepID=A0AAV7M8V9_PLEWA|nr:hypothetical protein NDU88_001681 [Pleurodeles waltl]
MTRTPRLRTPLPGCRPPRGDGTGLWEPGDHGTAAHLLLCPAKRDLRQEQELRGHTGDYHKYTFKHAQPALLYLVPTCIGFPLLVALVKGEIADMFRYEESPKEASEPTESEKKDN